jgi:hypothetical protein
MKFIGGDVIQHHKEMPIGYLSVAMTSNLLSTIILSFLSFDYDA